jgi:DNA mismatch endonuclease (patch repair protein)
MKHPSVSLPRAHRGDIMSSDKRSAVMSRIRGRDTGPELFVASALKERGLEWESHAKDLPGRPDFVFREPRVAVFIDGDFWHGWQFDTWRHKLSEKWEAKIAENIERDTRNRKALRKAGWTVVRVWEHQLEKNPRGAVRRLLRRISGRPSNN